MNKIDKKYTPPNSHYLHNHIYYKLGLHNMLYRWNGAEWIRSTFYIEILKQHALIRFKGFWMNKIEIKDWKKNNGENYEQL